MSHTRSSPVREILAHTARPGVISFAGGLPAPELFDAAGLAESFAAVLSPDRARRSLQYSITEGDPDLRAALARRLDARGIPTAPTELLITAGSQQALTLVAAALIEPGDRVLVEEPSYLAALQVFALAGATPVPVPCDEDGLIPGALADLTAAHRPKLLYTVPTFQNPTGRTMPAARRLAIARTAERTGLWLVEDDPYSELRYGGEHVPAIAALASPQTRVIAISTLSKVLAPGLRIGWIRARQPLLRKLTIAKQAADLHTSTIDQAAAAHWLEHHDLDDHIARLRGAYRSRRDALLSGLGDALPPGSRHNHPDGGMFVWARLPDGWDAGALLDQALACDVAYVPGVHFFCAAGDRATLRLSFTAHPADEIERGLERLARALKGPRQARTSGSSNAFLPAASSVPSNGYSPLKQASQ